MTKFFEMIGWLSGILRGVGKGFLLWQQVKKNGDDRFSSEKKRIAQGVRRFFERNYELRYNVMKQTEEFRPRRKQAEIEKYQADFFRNQAENSGEWHQLTCRFPHGKIHGVRGWYAKRVNS